MLQVTQRRRTCATAANPRSSRSHAFYVLDAVLPGGRGKGRLFLIDLAGSERIASGDSLAKQVETAYVNSSLSELGIALRNLGSRSVTALSAQRSM